jgi:hypothetical protein
MTIYNESFAKVNQKTHGKTHGKDRGMRLDALTLEGVTVSVKK